MKNFLQQINSYIKEAFNAGKYLYNGLSVTFDHLRRRPVTVQYPYEKLIPSERYRVRIDQLLDLGWKFLLPISLANLLITAGLKLAFPQFFGG